MKNPEPESHGPEGGHMGITVHTPQNIESGVRVGGKLPSGRPLVDPLEDPVLEKMRHTFRVGLAWGFLIGASSVGAAWALTLTEVL